MFGDRVYFGAQVNYAPGLYCAIAMSAPLLFMKFGSIYVCFGAWLTFFVAVIYNNPLFFLIKNDRVFGALFCVLSAFSTFFLF